MTIRDAVQEAADRIAAEALTPPPYHFYISATDYACLSESLKALGTVTEYRAENLPTVYCWTIERDVYARLMLDQGVLAASPRVPMYSDPPPEVRRQI